MKLTEFAAARPSGHEAAPPPAHATPPDHAGHNAAIAPLTLRLPLYFFALSALSLACGAALMTALAPRAVHFFYQPSILALTHLFTLGFISSAIMGVMYRYVPALTHRPIPFPRLAILQCAAYTVGVTGMIGHFAIANWTGLWWSAALVLASLMLFALNLLPLLLSGAGRGVAETGMAAAIGFLLLAGSLGLLMGLEEAHGWVFGNLLSTLSSHVTCAALGWVTIAICAASYRFVPAFLLPTRPLPRAALWQLLVLILATLGLAISLLLSAPGIVFWGLAVVAAMLAYAGIMITLARSRRLPPDWAMSHALAATLWLGAALALALIALRSGGWTPQGAPVSAAMIVAALLGWAGNFIIGMSYRLFPSFVASVRTALQFPALSLARLSSLRLRPFILAAFNAGLAMLTAALLLRAPALGRLGGALVLLAAVPYSLATCWTLSLGWRRAIPAESRDVASA